MAQRGRKTLFRDYMIEEGEKLAALGLIMNDIADFWGVNRSTLHRWSKKNDEFCNAIKRGKIKADTEVTKSLYKKAIGYDYTEQHFKTSTVKGEDKETKLIKMLDKEVVKHIQEDVTAQIFWLKNRRPDLWRDRRELEHSGEVDNNLTVEIVHVGKEEKAGESGKNEDNSK